MFSFLSIHPIFRFIQIEDIFNIKDLLNKWGRIHIHNKNNDSNEMLKYTQYESFSLKS